MAEPVSTPTEVPRLRPEMASRRLLVLAFVRRYIEQWEVSPSYGEIAAGVGISRPRARELALRLVADGHLLRTPGPRGLALPARRDQAVRHLRSLGWSIDEGGGVARADASPLTQSGLRGLPPLTYPSRHGDTEIQARPRAPEAGPGGCGATQGAHRARAQAGAGGGRPVRR